MTVGRHRRDSVDVNHLSVDRLCGLGAVSGVVVAHTLAYVVIFPDAGRRAVALGATGHGSWHLTLVVALAAGVAAAFVAVARGVASGRRPARPGGRRWPGLLELCLTQLVLFAALEVLERVAAGSSALVLLHERVFAAGLVLQAVVAVVVAIVLRTLVRVAAHVARRARRRQLRLLDRTPLRHLPAGFPAARPAEGAAGPRGPPVPA